MCAADDRVCFCIRIVAISAHYTGKKRKMPLPADFTFTQSNLQDYIACPRRFDLRYIQRQKWPAVETEPAREREIHMQQGADFHRMIQQHLNGVPESALTRLAQAEPLRHWWTAYLQHGLTGLPAQRHAELVLSAPLAGYRLLAKYDLIAIEPGERLVIVDWKTSQRVPPKAQAAARMQTLIYPYVLVEAGFHLNGEQPVSPEQVTMVYWYAEAPEQPHVFEYSAATHAANRDELADLIEEIKSRDIFDLTADESRCRFCVYRSLCDRGVEAGDEAELDIEADDIPDDPLDFDLDQIAEIEF